MMFNKTKLEGVYTIEPELKIDEKGYFSKIFCEKEMAKNGMNLNIIKKRIKDNKLNQIFYMYQKRY